MTTTRPWWHGTLATLVLPVLLGIALLVLVLYAVATVCLYVAMWTLWSTRGRDVLFVYSDSPIWHDYIVEKILPPLGGRAVVLNWSERKRWRPSLSRWAFRHFGGDRQFNPLAVVIRPFRRAKVFRFWQPFRDSKHGHSDALRQLEAEFFELIGIDGHAGA